VIIEHVLLRIRSGQTSEFEAAIVKARPLIAASPGFIDIEVRAAFRKSDRYEEWRSLLHGFYEPMPEVLYFGDIL
jgi:heme-degrading monooxygenase HmoA